MTESPDASSSIDVSEPDDEVAASEPADAVDEQHTGTAEPGEGPAAADPRVRDAVRRLDALADLPPAEHVEVYEAVHSSLQESLAEASRRAEESPAGGNAPS